MKEFIGKNFLLTNQTALELFENYAKDMPIFDYHNHLSAQEICQKRCFDNITQVWLENDHYKWRVMRVCGIDEAYITGNADDYDKFIKWAQTVEKIPGNPLYHWVHLELQRYFDIDEPLCSATAKSIWDTCNMQLGQPGFDAVGMMERAKVKFLCTTDEPADTLEWHLKIAQDDTIKIKVLPSFRPDRVLHIEAQDWKEYISKMQAHYGIKINSFEALKNTLILLIAYFKSAGCVVSDHGFIDFVYASDGNPEAVFARALAGETLTEHEIAQYKGALLRFLAGEYCKNNMAMQLHLGALRSNNTSMIQKLGPNTGFDSVGSLKNPALIGALLDDISKAGCLPRTVLYSLNPGDNAVLSTMAVNFACGKIPGKVQLGSAWWFLDNVRGIQNQIDELLETGLISTFIGMLTDSRSFTSFSRHEYFRRILCNKLGTIIENGEYACDVPAMGNMIKDICYNNAVRYFGLSEL
ncbi:MAG: glucuronate isomerase [Actinomycetota bacterium]|nr:glucuronate isomerase [Actinomycetota bacterium]